MIIKIDDDATFVADAHYNSLNRPEFLNYLNSIASHQIILMGDIFDLLFGNIELSIEQNREVIDLLNKLSHTKDIIYLEGNHDFVLQKIFPNIRVYPLELQPVEAIYRNRETLIAHGDTFGATGYRVYTSIIRTGWLLKLLNWIDRSFLNDVIMKKLIATMNQKVLCHDFEGFEQVVRSRVLRYRADYPQVEQIIEGHFHQDEAFEVEGIEYVNLPSMACANQNS
jgi:UDP-2,3-diacylglucosamine hydrolase